MSDLDVFQQDFAGWLLACAKARRRGCEPSQVTGEDLRVALLLERLAENAQHLDLHVFLVYQTILAEEDLARRFAARRDHLLGQIGTTCEPKSATDALRWMCRQVLYDELACPPGDKATIPAAQSGRASRTAGKPARKGKPAELLRSIRDDFCTGFSVVGPALAIWHLPVAVGQWRDRAFAGSHPTVPAVVISATPSGEGKSTGSAGSAVLDFKPNASVGSCRVVVHSTFPPLPAQPGQTLMVVPRSSDCELPLIPALIGDPLATLTLCGAFLLGGLVCLRPWRWRPAQWSRAGGQWVSPVLPSREKVPRKGG